jgi:hypothetical protein
LLEQDALDHNSYFKDSKGEIFYFDMFDSDEWVKHKLSVFGAGPVGELELPHLKAGLFPSTT